MQTFGGHPPEADSGQGAEAAAPRGVICFAAGSLILTPLGPCPVETLRQGDRVLTRDSGAREIRWIGRRTVAGLGELAPVRIAAGVLGASRDLWVSQQHRLLLCAPRLELYTGETEAFVPARHLADSRAVSIRQVPRVTYVHLMFDRPEVIWADGVACESFFVGASGRASMTAGMRAEFAALLPDLAAGTGLPGGPARPSLDRRETAALALGPAGLLTG